MRPASKEILFVIGAALCSAVSGETRMPSNCQPLRLCAAQNRASLPVVSGRGTDSCLSDRFAPPPCGSIWKEMNVLAERLLKRISYWI